MIQKRPSLSDGCKAVFRYVPPGRAAGQLRAVGKTLEATEHHPAQARLILAPYKVEQAPCPAMPDVALDRFAGP